MASNTKKDTVKADKPAEAPKAPALKFEYLCPACTNVALKTSNKMLGVDVNCQACGKLIKLDDEKRYRALK